MSRSRRHTPIHGMCADSEKYDKRKLNRRLRRVHREIVRKIADPEDEPSLPGSKELESNWTWAKDGKHYFGDWQDKEGVARWMRK